jgi:hypothetical protein
MKVRARPIVVFMTASIVTGIGNSIYILLLPILVYQRTHSALWMSMVAMVEGIPAIALGRRLGRWTDAQDARKVYAASEIGQAALVGVLVLLLSAVHKVTVRELVPVSFLVGLVGIFNRAAVGPLIGHTAAKNIARGTSMVSAARAIPILIGPAIAGFLIEFAGPARALMVDMGTFIVSTILVMTLPPPPRSRKRSDTSQRASGSWTALAGSGVLWALGILGLSNLIDSGLAPVVIFLGKQLGTADRLLGVTFAGGGLGAVIGSRLASVVGPPRASLLIGLCLDTLGLGILSLDSPATMVLGYTVLGLGGGFAATAIQILLVAQGQKRGTTGELFGMSRAIDGVARPSSYVGLGATASAIGVGPTLRLSAVVSLVTVALAMFGVRSGMMQTERSE